MALRKDPLKAFPAMDQRRDVVARGKSRIFIPCQSHQGEQESRMPFLPEQCAFPHGTHRHMLYPFFRQHARHGDDAVPVGVRLMTGMREGWRASSVFRLCLRFSRWTVMMALLKNMGPPRSSQLCW